MVSSGGELYIGAGRRARVKFAFYPVALVDSHTRTRHRILYRCTCKVFQLFFFFINHVHIYFWVFLKGAGGGYFLLILILLLRQFYFFILFAAVIISELVQKFTNPGC